jgi:hypothetical protein
LYAGPCASSRSSNPAGASRAARSSVASSGSAPASTTSAAVARTAVVVAPVTPMRAAAIRPAASSVTTAAMPTTAKREAGWGYFSYALPLRGGSRGMRISVSTSSGASAVVSRLTKKPDTGIVRSPWRPTARIVASSASITAGRSADGSACARLPPIVPRLRTMGSPICAAASASTGRARRTISELSSS